MANNEVDSSKGAKPQRNINAPELTSSMQGWCILRTAENAGDTEKPDSQRIPLPLCRMVFGSVLL
jgi:hypothetical protein